MTQFLQHLPSALVYLVVAAVVLSETALLPGVVVPSLTTLLVAGFLARVGTVNWMLLGLVTVVAGVVGDHLGYREGRRFGPRLRDSGAGRWIGPARWAKADRVLERRGGGAVFVGRWVTVVRTLVPRLAGASDMSLGRFFVYNTAGVVTWAAFDIGVGYLAGASYDKVAQRFGKTALALAVLAAGVVALVLISGWIGRHPQPGHSLGRALSRFRVTRWIAGHYVRGLDRLQRGLGRGGTLAVTVVVLSVIVGVGGYVIALLVQSAVVISGVADADRTLTRWLIPRRDPGLLHVAVVSVTTVRGALVLAVALLAAAVLVWRRRPGDVTFQLVRVVALFAPLVAAAAVIDSHQPHRPPADPTVPVLAFPGEHAVVIAGLGMLTWLVSHRLRPSWRRTAWAIASIAALVLTAARFYVGWSTPSSTAAALLLGGLWALTVIGAWHSSSQPGGPRGAAPATAERAEVSALADS